MAESLLSQYAPNVSRWDEMVDELQIPRRHWRGFLRHLASLPLETMRERERFVDEAVASDGVTYNVYADPKGPARPWELDPLPFILPSHEWQVIAAAIEQRARLLNAVLADIYGPQRLLAEGLVPPALVFGQRSFLWPAHGIVPPEGTFLHLYAADIARSPDGRFWILSDRTRGPSGAGYALQNRVTIARAFPDAFREIHVEPLAPFFRTLEETLYRLANARGEAPLAVLLTPGPFNETYFEHSFLARFLGFPLVEGQDLIVRGDAVYLKTLKGLRRVHAILRRLDDDYCDPVELRADSALGIPGLMHVVRAGNVLVANALGSGVLETGAFSGFYPAIAERLLGEPLRMPSIASWWCGETPALAYVKDHLDELVVKPAYPSIRMEPVFGHTLDAAARARLIERMQGQPHAYLAQERVRLSQTPTWSREERRLLPRATSLRVFAVATAGGGYAVMPGALTRVAPHDGDVVSMQWGGSSKDTWMLADEPVTRVPLRRPRLGVEDVQRSAVDIASRVGENLFWMGRYAERCEGLARVLRAALVRLADAAPGTLPALATLATLCDRWQIFPVREARSSRRLLDDEPIGRRSLDEAIVWPDFVAAVVDPALPGGLVANVLRLQGAASHVRERMSTDNWRVLNRLVRELPSGEASPHAALEFVDDVMMVCVSLAGFAMDDMTRDESWQFLLVARRLERLAHLSGMVTHVLRCAHADREASLEWLLEAANSIVTYRARFRREPELLPVLHLVVLDRTNPHAIAFQLRELVGLLERVRAELGGERVGQRLDGTLAALEAFDLSGFDDDAPEVLDRASEVLADTLAEVERTAYAVSDEIGRRFFSHAGSPAPLGVSDA